MNTRKRVQHGLSLVELLVGCTLSLILLAAMISLYLSAKQTYSVQDSLARMQENARLALRIIMHDARMAGYNGDVVQRWSIKESADQPLGAISSECHSGWARAPALPADAVLAPALTGANDTPGLFSGCIDDSAHIAGTDILSVHFTGANPLADNAIEKGKAYLRSTLHGGMIFKAAANGALPADFSFAGSAQNHRLIATTYYLRPWSVVAPSKSNPAGDAIPTLMRATLSDCGATACVKSEGLIEGIANLQLQFGVDSGAEDGALTYLNADQLGDFTQAVGKAQWRRVRTVRIGLLVRSLNPEPGFTDPNAPYHLGDQTVDVTDGYRHLWLTSTVALRNNIDD